MCIIKVYFINFISKLVGRLGRLRIKFEWKEIAWKAKQNHKTNFNWTVSCKWTGLNLKSLHRKGFIYFHTLQIGEIIRTEGKRLFNFQNFQTGSSKQLLYLWRLYSTILKYKWQYFLIKLNFPPFALAHSVTAHAQLTGNPNMQASLYKSNHYKIQRTTVLVLPLTSQ